MPARYRRKHKKTWPYWIIAGMVIGLLVWQFGGNLLHHKNRPPEKVTSLGVPIPEGYSEFGIDVSRYQEKIDWERVVKFRSGRFSVSFAFIKATEGRSLKDPYFNQNLQECRRVGINCGAYHFYNPRADATEQAQFFIRSYTAAPGDLPPILDVEKDYDKTALLDGVITWMNIVGKQYKTQPILYCNSTFYDKYFSGTTLDSYPLWLAHYKTNSPRISRKWDYWQWSDEANVDGINGPVDVNVRMK